MDGRILAGALAGILVLAGCLGTDPGLDSDSAAPATLQEATGFLFYNATVWTADPAQPQASAIAVWNNTIVGVGAKEDLTDLDLGASPIIMDLEGRMVLPGFIDTHTHFINVARQTDPADGNPYAPWGPGWDPVMGTIGQQETALGHIGTWGENNIDRLMAGEAPALPYMHLLVHLQEEHGHGHDHGHDHGHGHDHDGDHDHSHGLKEILLEELKHRFADHEGPLDGSDPYVIAAAQAGLLGDTLELEGRLSANDLGFDYWEQEAVPEDWLTMMKRGLATGAQHGITSHVEAGIGLDAFDALKRLDEAGELSARFNLYVFPEELDTVVDKGWTTGYGDDKARLMGLKVYSDGWLGPRTAALSELYNDRPHQGFAFYTQQEVDDFVLKAHQNGLKLTAHTIGDRAAEMLITAYENALDAGCSEPHPTCEDPRFTLEHVQLVPPELLDRMVAIDLIPSIQLSFAVSDSPWAENAVGSERLEQAYIWNTMHEAGLTLAGSSDFPIEPLPPLWGIERMVTRVDLDGTPAGGFQPHEAMELEQVLRMVTINAAKLTYQEDRLGSLEAGKLADLVVLEHDLFEIPTNEIHDTTVELTMMDGRVVHVGGGLVALLPEA